MNFLQGLGGCGGRHVAQLEPALVCSDSESDVDDGRLPGVKAKGDRRAPTWTRRFCFRRP